MRKGGTKVRQIIYSRQIILYLRIVLALLDQETKTERDQQKKSWETEKVCLDYGEKVRVGFCLLEVEKVLNTFSINVSALLIHTPHA